MKSGVNLIARIIPTKVYTQKDLDKPKKKKNHTTSFPLLSITLRDRFVHVFKHMFSVFKQHYMYFYILFYPHTYFQKIHTTLLEQRYQTAP